MTDQQPAPLPPWANHNDDRLIWYGGNVQKVSAIRAAELLAQGATIARINIVHLPQNSTMYAAEVYDDSVPVHVVDVPGDDVLGVAAAVHRSTGYELNDPPQLPEWAQDGA